MSRRCYVCGSAEKLVEFHPHIWLCAGCLPAGDHVVHMSTPGGKSLAECDCGWRSEVPFASRGIVQEAKVRLHWRDAIRRAVSDFDAIHGPGAARAEMLVGFVAVLGLIVNGTALLVACGVGS